MLGDSLGEVEVHDAIHLKAIHTSRRIKVLGENRERKPLINF